MPRQAEKDIISTAKGDLEIALIGHASLMFRWNGMVIHVDPVSAEADYAGLPKANLILVTHGHFDHLDAEAILSLCRPFTEIVINAESKSKLPRAHSLKNGEKTVIQNLEIEAVPAYNITGMRVEGVPYHPRGAGNGYVVTFADVRVYIAGDTEMIPEMNALKDITVAFLPLMRPYTMSPEMVAEAARTIRPKILYLYHTKETSADKVLDLLSGVPGIDIRLRA